MRVYERIVPILRELSSLGEEQSLSPDSRLVDDLALDSLSIVLLSVYLEEEFGRTFTFDDARPQTVADLCTFLELQLKE